jgi:hypothetical protein
MTWKNTPEQFGIRTPSFIDPGEPGKEKPEDRDLTRSSGIMETVLI